MAREVVKICNVLAKDMLENRARVLGFLLSRNLRLLFLGCKKTTPKGGLNTAVSKPDRYETDEILERVGYTNSDSVIPAHDTAVCTVSRGINATATIYVSRIHS